MGKMRDELETAYYNWLCSVVVKDERFSHYRTLLAYLHHIPFRFSPSVPMDDNRAGDGIELRYRFGAYHDISYSIIGSELDYTPCSVLEMLVALSIRCEEQIMSVPEMGDRTYEWFWTMIRNMFLIDQIDDHFNLEYVKARIDIFLDRRYQPDGIGGLFYIPNTTKNLQNVEIWNQLNWWANNVLEEEGRGA